MGRLIDALSKCAVCGSPPKILAVAGIDKDTGKEFCDFKFWCSGNSVHNSCGDWYENKYKACKSWNKRQEENWDGRRITNRQDFAKALAGGELTSKEIALHLSDVIERIAYKEGCSIAEVLGSKLDLFVAWFDEEVAE